MTLTPAFKGVVVQDLVGCVSRACPSPLGKDVKRRASSSERVLDQYHAVMVQYAPGMSAPAGLSFASLPEERGKLAKGRAQIPLITRSTREENDCADE